VPFPQCPPFAVAALGQGMSSDNRLKTRSLAIPLACFFPLARGFPLRASDQNKLSCTPQGLLAATVVDLLLEIRELVGSPLPLLFLANLVPLLSPFSASTRTTDS